MWADILTKPLQGTKFKTMPAQFMNCPVDYDESPQTLQAHKINHTITEPNTYTQSKFPLHGCIGTNANTKKTPPDEGQNKM